MTLADWLARLKTGSLALGAAAVSAGTTGESLWEEHSCQKRAGLHLTSSELPAVSSVRQHGSWTPENPVSAEKRQEAGRDQEIQRPRPEDRGESGAGVHMWRLQVANARSQDLQAAF